MHLDPQQQWQFAENNMGWHVRTCLRSASNKVCPMLLLLRWSQILSTRELGVGKPRTRQCRASQLLPASRCSQVVTALFAMSFSKWELEKSRELRIDVNQNYDSLTAWQDGTKSLLASPAAQWWICPWRHLDHIASVSARMTTLSTSNMFDISWSAGVR